MHPVVLLLWLLSLVLLAIAAFTLKPFHPAGLTAAGLLAFDLWIGLHFVLEVTDPVTF